MTAASAVFDDFRTAAFIAADNTELLILLEQLISVEFVSFSEYFLPQRS